MVNNGGLPVILGEIIYSYIYIICIYVCIFLSFYLSLDHFSSLLFHSFIKFIAIITDKSKNEFSTPLSKEYASFIFLDLIKSETVKVEDLSRFV